MSDPVSDLITFLTADTGDFHVLGPARFVFILIFYLLLAASVLLLVVNWREDPAERTGTNVWLWATRVLIGGMWFQGCLWKVPFTDNDGLLFWTKQLAGRAAYELHRELVSNVILPNFEIFHPLVFLAELGFAAALIVGLFVRLAGFAAALFTVNLWLGLYNTRPGDRPEWPWTYMFLILLCANFAVLATGRALGADAWLRRHVDSVRTGSGIGGLVRLIT
jgi:uncharacterized membrane protein YphA (DoxX/SURF4 family)